MSEMKTLEETVVEAFIEGLDAILKNIRRIYQTWQELNPAVKQDIKTGISAVTSVKNNFPEHLAEQLSFEIKEDCAIIKPKQFLGSDNFAQIAAVVRNLGGEYVSAGKESHFKILK